MLAPYISLYRPQLVHPQHLEVLQACPVPALDDWVERTVAFADGEAQPHLLVTGPWGSGKTHALALLHHRLSDRLSGTGACQLLWAESPDFAPRPLLAQSTDSAQVTVSLQDHILKQGERPVRQVFLVDGYDEWWTQLPPAARKALRHRLLHGGDLLIAASGAVNSQALLPNAQHVALPELTLEQARRLVASYSSLVCSGAGTSPLAIESFRAVHHLVGGNPRFWVTFAQELLSAADSGTAAYLNAVDKLLPCLELRMTRLSPQQRWILLHLCRVRRAEKVKAISVCGGMTERTASSQLKTLRDAGAVSATGLGRESYYEATEALMRQCVAVERREEVLKRLGFLQIWHAREPFNELPPFPRSAEALPVDFLWKPLRDNMPGARGYLVESLTRSLLDNIAKNLPVKALQDAEELCKERGRPWDFLALCHCRMALGRWAQALESIDVLLEMRPDHALGLCAKTLLLLKLERFQEALAVEEEMTEAGRHFGWPHSLDAAVLLSLGRDAEAAHAADTAVRVGEPAPAPQFLRALGFARIGRYDAAVVACRDSLAAEEGHGPSLALLAGVLCRAGRPYEAVHLLERAGAPEKPDANVRAVYGGALAMLQHYDAALQVFEASRGGVSYDAFMRVRLIFRMGATGDGRQALHDVLESRPEQKGLLAGYAEQLVRDAARTTQREQRRRMLEAVAETFERLDLVTVLAVGLVAALPALRDSGMTIADLEDWEGAWQALARDPAAYAPALDVQAAALAFYRTGKPHALLGLPIEERALL